MHKIQFQIPTFHDMEQGLQFIAEVEQASYKFYQLYYTLLFIHQIATKMTWDSNKYGKSYAHVYMIKTC